MKKYGLLLVFVTSFAGAATLPFSTGPAPVQTYQTTQSSQASSQPTPVVSAQSVDGAAVIASTNTQNTAQNTPSVAPTAGTPFQQQAEAQIQNLDESDQAIGTALQTVEQNILQLQHAVNALQSKTISNTAVKTDWSFLDNPDVITSSAIAVAAALLLTLGVLIGKRRRRHDFVWENTTAEKNTVLEDDTKNEFDFMSTKEAIPAKLDLARAYVAMQDWTSARDILNMITEKGNEEQQQEAKSLLQKLK